ncbi:MAG: TonB-dependent receptor plug domain-containing protein [Flavobacteriaceae bacterium]
MKQFLLWCIALFVSTTVLAQKHTAFEQEELRLVLPKIASFYNTNFSYTDQLIAQKKVSILLDDIIPLESLLLTLSAQTDLKFEQINAEHIVITSFTNDDVITVCGQLQCNNKTIQNAVIQINNTTYFSDQNGQFKINNIPYNATINISSFGVKNTTLKASEHTFPNCITISLTEKIEALDQVIIDEYLTSGISKNIKQTTIDTKKSKILPGLIEPDILESIHQIPGVTNLNETVNNIYVRGGNTDQNLILWNNITTYGNTHMFGAISAFNPYIIDKVNFISKGTNPKYGERVSSVIDITSNYKPTNKLKGGAGFNMLHADAFIDLPIIDDKLSVLISGRRSYADALETFTYKNYTSRIFQNTKIYDNNLDFSKTKQIFWFYDYTVNAAWKLSPKNLIKINHLYTEDYLNFSAINSNNTNLYTDALKTKNRGSNIVWEKEWTTKFSHQIDTYLSEYNFKYSYSNQSNTDIIIDSKDNNITDFGINTTLTYDFDEYKQANLGYQYSNKKFNYRLLTNNQNQPTSLTENDAMVNANSLFMEYQINKPKDFLYTLGLRANHYSNTNKLFLEPRVILQKFVIPEFSISASLEYKSQYINQIQESVINNLSLDNNVWALSNSEDLPILTSYQYTVGLNYSKNKWVVDFEAYFKKTNNINTLNFDFDNQNSQTSYIGESSIQGVDFFLKKQLKNYNSWLSYSFNSAKYRFPDLNEGKAFPSNFNINHTVKWSHFYKWKQLEFTLGWLWHNGKPYTEICSTTNPDNSVSYSYTGLNNKTLKPYHRLDFSAIYDFRPHKNKTIKYRIGCSILNLYNRKNIINKDVRFSNTNSNILNINDIRGSEISPNIMLRVFW